MKIGGSVALVTGANRGLGREYARELVRRGQPSGVRLHAVNRHRLAGRFRRWRTRLLAGS